MQKTFLFGHVHASSGSLSLRPPRRFAAVVVLLFLLEYHAVLLMRYSTFQQDDFTPHSPFQLLHLGARI